MQESQKISKFTTMLEEIVNNAIIDRRNVLANRQMHPESHDVVESFEKAKAAQEGEVRTHGGVKVKKVGGKWVPVAERRAAPEKPSSSKERKKKEESSAPKAKKDHGIPSHHMGTLKHVKKLVNSGDMAAAHEMANKLPDDVKSHIPEKVWQNMSEATHEAGKKAAEEKANAGKKEEANTDPAKMSNAEVIAEDEKSRVKRFVEKNKKMFDTGEHAHPERSKAAKFLRGKAKGIVKGLKTEVEHFKEAGTGIAKLVQGKKPNDHEKHAFKKIGISLGLTVGTMLATGGTSVFAHGAGAFMKHLGIHFVEHGLIEVIGLASIFAKAVEEELKGQDVKALSDKELEKILAKVVDAFISHIESGDWSDLLKEFEESEESGNNNEETE